MHGQRDSAHLRETARSLGGSDGPLARVAGDVRDRRAVDRMFAARGPVPRRLDFLVVNAGAYAATPSEAVTADEWHRMTATNLEGSFWTVRAALPRLRRSPHAAVVLVSSILASRPIQGGVPSQSTKAGVEQMTRALAVELAPGVRVNAVAPGYVRTRMNRRRRVDRWFHAQLVRSTPLHRWAEPEDLGPPVRYLLSDEAGWVTGAVVHATGGLDLS